MYLEISARGSGKTTRLRDAARKHLSASPQNIAIIVSETAQSALFKCRSINYDRAFQSERLVPAETMYVYQDVKGVRYFVDDVETISSGRLAVNADAHYALWAKAVRQSSAQDFVRELIATNHSRYASYGPLGDQQEDRRTYGDATFFEETSLDWETPIVEKKAA